MDYKAPLADILFSMNTADGFVQLRATSAFADFDEETAKAVLGEAGRLMADIIAPLNAIGDQHPARLEDGKVIMPPGWRKAYQAYAEGGWQGLPFAEGNGGMGLPNVMNIAVAEMMNSANLAFGVGPLVSQGAIEALSVHGSDEIRATYLSKLVSGEWSATMNLTEPQAGTDLALLKTKAEPAEGGAYKISGTKIFITYGEHDLTNNIIHLVLARLSDAPTGTKGISLFLVPKFLVDENGELGERNDVACSGVEHKLGIHGSPTCVMSYGDNGGATGFLVGEPHGGLRAMFTMMNNARLAVGIQGVGISERSFQAASQYAKGRLQGQRPDHDGPAPIIDHPDVRRNLTTIKAMTAASRAICYAAAVALDLAQASASEETRAHYKARADLLTPLAKAYSTDNGVEAASIGLQIHGGMGYIEETGAAQILRDARICPIYEGTNGIQAIDLLSRKVARDQGAAAFALIAELRDTASDVMASNEPVFGRMGFRLNATIDELEEATQWLLGTIVEAPDKALAGATPYLKLFSLAAGGGFLARGVLSLSDQNGNAASNNNRRLLARFFAENLVPEAGSLRRTITGGADGLLAFDLGET